MTLLLVDFFIFFNIAATSNLHVDLLAQQAGGIDNRHKNQDKKYESERKLERKEDIEKVFGNVEYVDANIDGEFGFITEKISEATFAKKADELGTVISRIRIEG